MKRSGSSRDKRERERENFFFLNKNARELNRGKGELEACGRSKSDATVFGKA